MNPLFTLLILVVAAGLEAGGDALARTGLHAHAGLFRVGFFVAAAVVLFTYGVVVNLPPWDFGKLLGVYVVLFFLVAQTINYFAFGQTPTLPIVAGGALIVAGGLVMTLWRV